MWIDEQGAMHTVWTPPEAILGDETVAALRSVADDVAADALDALDSAYDDVVDAAEPGAPPGPVDLDDVPTGDIPHPPVIPGLLPVPGQPLADTVLAFIDRVPPIWRLEVFEAVSEVLDRSE